MQNFYILLAIISSILPVFGMEIVSFPEQENTSAPKIVENHKVAAHGTNGFTQTAPDLPTVRPHSPVEVISDREKRSSSSSSEADAVPVFETAEEQEVATDLDRFFELAERRKLWEQKFSRVAKSRLIAKLKASKKGNDLTEFLEAALEILELSKTPEWASLLVDATYEIYKSEGCAILDAACLLNNNGRLDFWIAEYCAQLQKGWQDKFLETLNHTEGAFSPLQCAIRAGAFETVKLLVTLGADVCKSNSHGQTPLMNAASLGHVDTIEFLLEKGAQKHIDVKDSSGRTAFYYAVDGDETAAAGKLLARGASVTAHGDKLEALLRMAIVRTNPEMVQLLLNAGVSPNQLLYGEPPLVAAIDHFALWLPDPIWGQDKERQARALKVIGLFVEHPSTDINIRGINGISALSTASYHCFNTLKGELIERGAVE